MHHSALANKQLWSSLPRQQCLDLSTAPNQFPVPVSTHICWQTHDATSSLPTIPPLLLTTLNPQSLSTIPLLLTLLSLSSPPLMLLIMARLLSVSPISTGYTTSLPIATQRVGGVPMRFAHTLQPMWCQPWGGIWISCSSQVSTSQSTLISTYIQFYTINSFFMTEPRFGPEPRPLNLNLEILIKVHDFLDWTSGFEFRFKPKCPKPEPDWTVNSVMALLSSSHIFCSCLHRCANWLPKSQEPHYIVSHLFCLSPVVWIVTSIIRAPLYGSHWYWFSWAKSLARVLILLNLLRNGMVGNDHLRPAGMWSPADGWSVAP